MVSNEKLALLYNEAKSKKDKENIFLKVKKNLENDTEKIIKFWIYQYSNKNKMSDDFEDFRQVADMILLQTLNMFPNTNERFKIRLWYIKILGNRICDIVKKRKSQDCNTIGLSNYFEDNNSYKDEEYNTSNFDSHIDNEKFNNIILLYIDKAITNKNQKIMFLLNFGFTKRKKSYTYDQIARRFGCTRQNVSQACKRNLNKIVKLLEDNIGLDKIKEYLY